MLTALVVVAVLVVLLIAAVAATHEGDLLIDAPADAADVGLPTLMVQPEDVAEVRFGMALRGYRMSEVDHVLDRLAQELAGRDAQIAALQDALADVVEPVVAAAEAEQAEQAEEPAVAQPWKQPMPHNPAPAVTQWHPAPVAASVELPAPDPAELLTPAPEELPPSEPSPWEPVPVPVDPTPSEPAPVEQPAPIEEPAPFEEPAPETADPVPLSAFSDDGFPEVLAPEDAPVDLPDAHEPPVQPQTWSAPPTAFPTAPPVQAPPSGEGSAGG